MEEHALKGVYISVLRNGVLSYGGSQRWSDSATLRQCGCGVIAALDLLLYLRQQRTDCRGLLEELPSAGPIPWPLYDRCARQLLWASMGISCAGACRCGHPGAWAGSGCGPGWGSCWTATCR